MYTYHDQVARVTNEERLSQLRGEAVAYRLSRSILRRQRKDQDRRGRGQPPRLASIPRQQPRQPQLEEAGLGKQDAAAADLPQWCAA
jgi:hypothetical protein